jgi:hypothetical protein
MMPRPISRQVVVQSRPAVSFQLEFQVRSAKSLYLWQCGYRQGWATCLVESVGAIVLPGNKQHGAI